MPIKIVSFFTTSESHFLDRVIAITDSILDNFRRIFLDELNGCKVLGEWITKYKVSSIGDEGVFVYIIMLEVC